MVKKIIIIILILFVNVGYIFGDDMRGKLIFCAESRNVLHIIDIQDKKTWENPVALDFKGRQLSFYHSMWYMDCKRILSQVINYNNKPTSLILINPDDLSFEAININIDSLIPANYGGGFKNLQISPNDRYICFDVFEFNKGHRLAVYDIANDILDINKKVFLELVHKLFWLPNSEEITFQTDKRTICIYNINTQDIRELDNGTNPVVNSADRKIYYTGRDNHLYAIDINDGKPKLIDRGNWRYSSPIGFSRDGKKLFYINPSALFPPEKWSIYVFDIESKKNTRISKKYTSITGCSFSDCDRHSSIEGRKEGPRGHPIIDQSRRKQKKGDVSIFLSEIKKKGTFLFFERDIMEEVMFRSVRPIPEEGCLGKKDVSIVRIGRTAVRVSHTRGGVGG